MKSPNEGTSIKEKGANHTPIYLPQHRHIWRRARLRPGGPFPKVGTGKKRTSEVRKTPSAIGAGDTATPSTPRPLSARGISAGRAGPSSPSRTWQVQGEGSTGSPQQETGSAGAVQQQSPDGRPHPSVPTPVTPAANTAGHTSIQSTIDRIMFPRYNIGKDLQTLTPADPPVPGKTHASPRPTESERSASPPPK